jgi:hypothetical protein
MDMISLDQMGDAAKLMVIGRAHQPHVFKEICLVLIMVQCLIQLVVSVHALTDGWSIVADIAKIGPIYLTNKELVTSKLF